MGSRRKLAQQARRAGPGSGHRTVPRLWNHPAWPGRESHHRLHGGRSSLLTCGVLMERRPNYLTYGRGLIAGGLAAIYFTAYAMHGLEAAQGRFPTRSSAPRSCLASPLPSCSFVLLQLATRYGSRIFRSFRQSEPEPAHIVFCSRHPGSRPCPSCWSHIASGGSVLAAAGVLFTYVSFVLRYDPTIYNQSGLFNGQASSGFTGSPSRSTTSSISRREGTAAPIHLMVSTLNATGFVAASFLHQTSVNATDWSRFLALGQLSRFSPAQNSGTASRRRTPRDDRECNAVCRLHPRRLFRLAGCHGLDY